MGYPGRKANRWKIWLTLLVSLFLLLLAGGALLFFRHITGMLPTEQAATRWAHGDERFGQVSAFFPQHHGLGQTEVRGIMRGVQGNLIQQGFSPPGEDGWGGDFSYAYSAQGILQLVSEQREVTAYASFVGGNFFLFQSVYLISGAYLPVDPINRDMVLINETLAWWLFGATDVADGEMGLYIDGKRYIVSGVYRPFGDFASQAAYGEGPHLFLYYEAAGDAPPPITAVQAVLPNPISGFAESFFAETLETAGVAEEAFVLVNHTERYTIAALLRVIGDFGGRSMYRVGLNLPPWENAARMSEDYAALALLLMVLLLVFPVLRFVIFLIGRFRRRRFRFFRWLFEPWKDDAVMRMVLRILLMATLGPGLLILLLWRWKWEEREARKLRAWRESKAPKKRSDDETKTKEQETGDAYDLEEIIRSVRESEGQDE